MGHDVGDGRGCWHCGGPLIWGGDFSFEDYGMDGDGIVSNLSCAHCGAYVEYFISFGGDDDDEAEL